VVLSLCAEDIEFAYPGGPPVLRGVGFALAAGQALCVLGPNGTGKTTLLRCVLGLERPRRGRVAIGGRDIARLGAAERARLAAYVPQSAAPAFPFPAFDVVLMGRSAHLGFMAGPTSADRRLAHDALARVGVAHLADRPFHRLSGGERQLVLIARALAQGSRLLVMDEPCAGLDVANQVMILGTIRALAGAGYAVLLSTHDPDHAFALGGLAALLRDGTLRGPAPAADLLDAATLGALYGTPVEVVALTDGRRLCVPVMPRD
jgi:iron complex transport system ATP-binding protein